jgi:hypothetical protein
MRHSSLCLAAAGLIALRGHLAAQAIPPTIVAAEAEGAALRHSPSTAMQSVIAVAPYSGTNKRQCVIAPPDDSLTGGFLRSGDMILRTHFSDRGGIHSGKPHKILWLPLHSASSGQQPLLIRAARINHSSDSIRRVIPMPTHSHGAYGYPSSITFPASGEWLVLVSTDTDWGCFVMLVER